MGDLSLFLVPSPLNSELFRHAHELSANSKKFDDYQYLKSNFNQYTILVHKGERGRG